MPVGEPRAVLLDGERARRGRPRQIHADDLQVLAVNVALVQRNRGARIGFTVAQTKVAAGDRFC